MDSFGAGPVSAVVFYGAWLVGQRASIRLRPEGIIIENIVVRHVIPWRQGRQFYVHNGLRLRLLDGRTYGIAAFQGSLVSKLAGYPVHHQIAKQLTVECDRLVVEDLPEFPAPPTRRHLQLPDLWVLFAVAVAVDGLIGLAVLSR